MEPIRRKLARMGMLIRFLEKRDVVAVQQMLAACQLFTADEVNVALELLSQALAGGAAGDYPLFVAEVNGTAHGYICIGKVPLTRGTWHLYWIVVHPAVQGRGVGRALQLHAEEFIRGCGGERIALETSSRAEYARTRRFYRRAGYKRVGAIRDFYKPGDDCIMFCKTLSRDPEHDRDS